MAMMLRLRIGPGLFECDRDLLDKLVGPAGTAFLIQDDSFLHPVTASLFPPELVSVAGAYSRDSMFTQRYSHGTNSSEGSLEISCGFITEDRNGPVHFGVVVSAAASDLKIVERDLARACRLLRYSSQTAAVIGKSVEALDKDSAGAILIDRSSGKIVAHTLSVNQDWGINPTELINSTFSDFQSHLARPNSGWAYSLHNLDHCDGNFTACIIHTNRRTSADTCRSVVNDLVHSIRNRISTVTAASSHLASMKGSVIDDDLVHLAETATSDAIKISALVDRLRQLLDFTDTESVEEAIDESINEAVRRVTEDSDSKATFDIVGDVAGKTYRLPRGSLTQLLEGILRGHLEDNPDPSWTVISVGTGDSSSDLTLSVETATSKSIGAPSASWLEYTRTLGKRIGIPVADTAIGPDGKSMYTRINLK